MDREYIQQHDIIDKYLLGKLSEEEATQFEEFCMTSESTFSDLQAAEKIVLGAKLLSEKDWDIESLDRPRNTIANDVVKNKTSFNWRSLFTLPTLAPAAMSFILGCVSAFVLIKEPADEIPTRAVLFELSTVRQSPTNLASDPVNIVRLNNQLETVVLIAPVTGSINSTYLASLGNEQNNEVLEIEDLEVTGPNKEILISISSKFFKPGIYSLKIANTTTPSDASVLKFKVIRDIDTK